MASENSKATFVHTEDEYRIVKASELVNEELSKDIEEIREPQIERLLVKLNGIFIPALIAHSSDSDIRNKKPEDFLWIVLGHNGEETQKLGKGESIILQMVIPGRGICILSTRHYKEWESDVHYVNNILTLEDGMPAQLFPLREILARGIVRDDQEIIKRYMELIRTTKARGWPSTKEVIIIGTQMRNRWGAIVKSSYKNSAAVCFKVLFPKFGIANVTGTELYKWINTAVLMSTVPRHTPDGLIQYVKRKPLYEGMKDTISTLNPKKFLFFKDLEGGKEPDLKKRKTKEENGGGGAEGDDVSDNDDIVRQDSQLIPGIDC